MGPVCTNVRGLLSTNNCIVVATAIPTANVPWFPPATSITDSLSLAPDHSRCWYCCLCYKPTCIDWLMLLSSFCSLPHSTEKKV